MKKGYKVLESKKVLAAFETMEKAIDYINSSNDNSLTIKESKLSKSLIALMIKTDYTYFYGPMPDAWKEFFPVITVNELNDFGLHTTTNHTGKMTGMFSWSTTCRCNNLCRDKITASFKTLGIDITDKKSAKDALKEYLKENPFATNICICGFCFSDSQQDTFPSMTIALERNYKIFNDGIIHSDWIPALNNLYFRGESFGDFNSVYSVINFYNLANYNPDTRITAWTKNLWFFKDAENMGYKKPENFTLIYSSPFINKPGIIPESCQHLVDKRFTVYTPEYAKKYGININCGARACMSCLKCYKANDIFDICELLK